MTQDKYELITEYLARLYDIQAYERHGIQHPVVHYQPSPEQVTDVDSIIGHLNQQMSDVETMSFYNYAYLHSLQNSGRNLFNGTTFTLRRLRSKPLRIDGGLGNYFDMIATCAALEQELHDVFDSGLVRLPMRAQYHRDVDARNALTHGKGRSAALGGLMLIVFKHEGQYKAIVSRRTSAHATHPNILHLLPAFIFQPVGDDSALSQWTFKQHLYREYLEELVGMPEEGVDMLSHPALKDLQAMEADGRAIIHLTGASLNLMTLRVEISTVLVIHEDNWWRDLQSGANGYALNTPESSDALLLISIEDDAQIQKDLPDNYYLNMVTQAIPAFWEGVDAARKIIADFTS